MGRSSWATSSTACRSLAPEPLTLSRRSTTSGSSIRSTSMNTARTCPRSKTGNGGATGQSNDNIRIPPPTFDPRRTKLNRRSNNGDEVPVRKHRRSAMANPSTTSRARGTDAALERRLDRLGLTGQEDDWTDRYLLCEHLVDPATALPRQRFEAVARFIRDLVAHRWVK